MKDVTRIVDVLVRGRWCRRPFAKLVAGDLFRLYKGNMTPVEWLLVNEALGEPCVKGQTLGIKCRPAGRRR